MTVGIYPAKNILLIGKPEALEYKNSGAFSFGGVWYLIFMILAKLYTSQYSIEKNFDSTQNFFQKRLDLVGHLSI